MRVSVCGISKVHFEGEKYDWIELKQKACNLVKYGAPKEWVNKLENILQKFIDTIEGNVDV